jgi:hypothetical protein
MSQRHPKRRRSRHEPSITPEQAKRSKDAANAWRVREQADALEAEAKSVAEKFGYYDYDARMREVARLRAVADQMERSGNQLGVTR